MKRSLPFVLIPLVAFAVGAATYHRTFPYLASAQNAPVTISRFEWRVAHLDINTPHVPVGHGYLLATLSATPCKAAVHVSCNLRPEKTNEPLPLLTEQQAMQIAHDVEKEAIRRFAIPKNRIVLYAVTPGGFVILAFGQERFLAPGTPAPGPRDFGMEALRLAKTGRY